MLRVSPNCVIVYCPRLLRKQVEIEAAVLGGVEDRLATVPALCHVVSDAGKDNARAAGHASEKSEKPARILSEMRLSPFHCEVRERPMFRFLDLRSIDRRLPGSLRRYAIGGDDVCYLQCRS